MNWHVILQFFRQICGIVTLEHKYRGMLPNTDNFRSEVRYSLPFYGAWTVVNGGITQETSHSWDIPTQRYAYDFVILDECGHSFAGDETNPAAFYCYGRDILAPADGIVEGFGEGQPDSTITADRMASCKAQDIRGNYILIRHTEKEYSLMAHLKQGSIRVHVGQKVYRGQKIAQCGNSGNTSEPHLHFQLQAGRSFYASPGLPILFTSVEITEAPNYEAFDSRNLFHKIRRPTPYIEVGQRVSNKACPKY